MIRKLSFAALALAGLLLLAWLSAPAWMGALVASRLPPPWQLQANDLSRPGLSGIDVGQASLNGAVAGLPVSLEVSNLRLHWAGLRLAAESVTVHLHLNQATESGEPFTLDKLSVPLLVSDTGVPRLEVTQLLLLVHMAESGVQAYLFEQLRSEPAPEGGVRISSDIVPAGQGSGRGRLQVDSGPSRFSANLELQDRGLAPWLQLSLQQQPEAGAFQSKLEAELQLGLQTEDGAGLLPASLAKLLPAGLSGAVRLEALFEGDGQQGLSQALVRSSGLRLDTDELGLSGDLHVQARADGGRLHLQLPDTSEFRVEDKSGRLSRPLLEQLGIADRPAGESGPEDPQTWRLQLPGGSEFQWQPGAEPPWQASLSGHLEADVGWLDSLAVNFTDLQLHPDGGEMAGSGQIRLSLKGLAAGTLAMDDASLSWQGMDAAFNGPVQFNAQGIMLADASELELNGQGIRWQEMGAAGGRELTLSALQLAGQPGLAWPLVETTDDNQLRLSWQGTARASGLQLKIPEKNAEPMVVNIASLEGPLQLLMDSGQMTSEGRASLAGLHLQPLEARVDSMALEWASLDLGALDGNFRMQAERPSLRVDAVDYTPNGLDLNVRLQGGRKVTGTGHVRLAADGRLPLSVQGDLEQGHWQVEVEETSLDAAQLSSLLSVAQVPIPDALALTGGSYTLSVSLALQESMRMVLDLAAVDGSAQLGESSASAIGLDIQGQLNESLNIAGAVEIGRAALAAGLDVEALAANLDLSGTESLALDELRGQLLGGTLASERLELLEGVLQPATLRLDGIDLGQLLAFVDVSDLSGSGTLDILLPVRGVATAADVKEAPAMSGLSIADGHFAARGPGHISYRSGGLQAASNIGLRALENFQYDSLDGSLEYSTEGPYRIVLNLLGRNPEVYDGYPIKFSLTLNGELPAVFQSLFLTGDFEDAILARVRQQQLDRLQQ